MDYEVIQRNENTWSIEDRGVRFFLLTGTERALLIDSGHFISGVKEIARSLTDLPLQLLNTHADPDHIGGNGEFDSFYMNTAEASNYYKDHGGKGTMLPVENGDVLDLGDRPLEILVIPGHTPGSIAVLDRKTGILFSGDTVQNGNIFMFGPQRELHAFICSLEKLERMKDRFTEIYPSHGSLPLSSQIIPQIREGAEKVLAGEIERTAIELFGRTMERCDIGCCGLLYDGK